MHFRRNHRWQSLLHSPVFPLADPHSHPVLSEVAEVYLDQVKVFTLGTVVYIYKLGHA
jgi:hypothetical protein